MHGRTATLVVAILLAIFAFAGFVTSPLRGPSLMAQPAPWTGPAPTATEKSYRMTVKGADGAGHTASALITLESKAPEAIAQAPLAPPLSPAVKGSTFGGTFYFTAAATCSVTAAVRNVWLIPQEAPSTEMGTASTSYAGPVGRAPRSSVKGR